MLHLQMMMRARDRRDCHKDTWIQSRPVTVFAGARIISEADYQRSSGFQINDECGKR